MPERLFAETPDGWMIALWRYLTTSNPSGLPALLIPGYPSDRRVFDPGSGRKGLVPFLLGRGRETWVVEVRTMGDSRLPAGEPDREWAFDDYVGDVLAAMDLMKNVLGPGKIHVAAHSQGGLFVHRSADRDVFPLVQEWMRRHE